MHQLCGQMQHLSLQVQSDCEVVSDVGIVKSITLKNFMCHANLGPFDFGSNVNFVVGKNGSELLLIHPIII